MRLDVKVYCCGCVSCHKVVARLQKMGDIEVEKDELIVMKIASETVGLVPVFEFNNKFFNERDIDSMINNGETFILPTEEKNIVTNIKQELNKKDINIDK